MSVNYQACIVLKFKSVSLIIYINSLWSWSNLQLSSNKESNRVLWILKKSEQFIAVQKITENEIF